MPAVLIGIALVLLMLSGIGYLLMPRCPYGNAPQARVDATEAMLGLLDRGIEEYCSDVGLVPESLSQLISDSDPGWTGPYIRSTATTDPWGNPFVYLANADKSSYALLSLGADAQPGGSGENANRLSPGSARMVCEVSVSINGQ